ncbi:MAG TPA: hypothetical protein VFU31_02725 [Candidatus Binatia bacterium]|nr:hypothetical protein [Candidatus Binatia bacterium]
MDTAFLQVVLLFSGFFFGLVLFLFVLVPFFYGLPRLLSWTARRYLEWRTLFLYLLTPSLCILGLLAVAHILGLFFGLYIGRSYTFSAGLWVAIVLKAARLVFSETARLPIRRQLLNFVTPYLTAKGELSLRGLWAQVPQIPSSDLRSSLKPTSSGGTAGSTKEFDVSETPASRQAQL